MANDLAISHAGLWAGSTAFSGGALSGYIDWAVYPPGGFPYAGFVPTAGRYTYAYQIYVTGTAPVSHLDIDLANSSFNIPNIGSFPLAGGIAPTTAAIAQIPFSPRLASWDFAGIPGGSNSTGLAFSDPYPPGDWFGAVIDTGVATTVIPIPSPQFILPEPAGVTLLALATVCGLPFVSRALRGQSASTPP